MKKILLSLLTVGFLLAAGCTTVPVSGRKQLTLVPGSTLLSLSYDNYSQFLNTNKLSTNQAQTRMVQNCGVRIQKAVEEYMANNNMSDRLRGFKWEFNLVEDKTVNAWCMPGGKVVVYTGILDVAQTEAGLAVIMGHEIAHAVADHGNERMTQGLLAQAGQMGLSVYMQNKPAETQAMLMAAYGAGAQVGLLLPFSRMHETEADKLGLIFMAMAGYDPREAPRFWERMSALGGASPPEFLSTHPAPKTRIQNLNNLIPEAMKHYKAR